MSSPPTTGHQVNTIMYFNLQKFTSLTPKTSSKGDFLGVTGSIFYFFSAGYPSVYEIEIFIDEAMGWQSLTKGTVNADVLKAVDVDYFIPSARVKVTPSDIRAIFTAKAFGYPSVYVRGPGDPYV